MKRKAIVICIDGCGPEYIDASETPCIDEIGKRGFFRVGRSVVPSVTNVNNVSIITGSFPETHGLTGNYYYDRATGKEMYMESPELLLAPTVCERLAGRRQDGHGGEIGCAVLTSKEKLLRMLGRGADLAIAAECPPAGWAEVVGPVENIYSAEINYWLLRAAKIVLQRHDPEFMYVSTTDFVMHKFAPASDESRRHIATLDMLIGEILEVAGDRCITITADHGMNRKSRALDIEKLLLKAGIKARAVPIIKDKLMAHHQGLGGASYVYLPRSTRLVGARDVDRAVEVLGNTAGVEEVSRATEAAAKYRLHAERIGDLLVLGDEKTVFGEFDSVLAKVAMRSHGSAHERSVPIVTNDSDANPDEIEFNLDVVEEVLLRGSGGKGERGKIRFF